MNREVREVREIAADNRANLRETNTRLDFLSDGQIRMRTDIADLHGDLADMRGDIVHLNSNVTNLSERFDSHSGRFDHFVETEGGVVRDLKTRVARMEAHLGLQD